MTNVVKETAFSDLKLLKRGKVRDVYDLGDRLLIVATDRLSAFDVVLPQPIPDKGKVLTQISNFWFDKTRDIIENHILTISVDNYPPECESYKEQLAGRSVIVKKTSPLPIECVARGYLAGSGWLEYRSSGSVCGIHLPHGLSESSRLPEPIFTPATKAEVGHDENISFDRTVSLVGREIAERVRDVTLAVYRRGCEVAERRGIIVADTKMEFGLVDGRLILIDELLTPDSSRFWPQKAYQPGVPQQSYDKQYVRDYLESIHFNKKPPGPQLPAEVISRTSSLYRDILKLLTDRDLS